MTRKQEKVRLYFSSYCEEKREIQGLSALINQLEKNYFSKVSVRNSAVCREENNLVIELRCPLELHEVLYHMQQGNWGGQNFHLVRKGDSGLRLYMQELRDLNSTFMDVEELAIELRDCTIVIRKNSDESIEFELDTILSTLAEHYVHLTRHLTVTPLEIFIPVYEEVPSDHEINRLISSIKIDNNGYYSYWGLYFDSEEEAVIYDLKNKKIISGDLNLLNL